MPDPIMTVIAATLASKTTETVFAGAKGALTALARLVRERFSHDENARKALDSAKNAPHDRAAVTALAGALDRLASADRESAARVRHLWREVEVAAEGNVMNSIGTSYGPVVQGRDFGDIHFGKS